jgi:penicillin-binding protein 2
MNPLQHFRKKLKRSWFNRGKEGIDPDEIFLDSTNLPKFNTDQFEGRIEQPISSKVVVFAGIFFLIVGLIYSFRVWNLQIKQGVAFAARSENNRLRDTIVFADRGVIYDRNQSLLAWNVENDNDPDFSARQYATTSGASNIIGYVKYPSKDTSGFYYQEDYVGKDGIEKFFDERLKGKNGVKITETSASGAVESQNTMNPPQNGENIHLSIDARIQSHLYDTIKSVALDRGFTGGAGVMMDVKTGEILAEVTYPEYDNQVLTDGSDKQTIQNYFVDKSNLLLDRATSGLYTPGSIVKPVMALAALDTHTISPDTVLMTHGFISIPNPYDPSSPTLFRDWKDQGPLDMRHAIQQSSDVYFYEVGGGYLDQKGMGIQNIDKYTSMFGYGRDVGSPFFGMKKGLIPSPEWKAATFDGEAWRLGDTYHSVIGQYGWQVTPLQVVRAIGAIANNGTLLHPTILAGDTSMLKDAEHINLPQTEFNIVHEGMRLSAIQGTAVALNVDYVKIGAKTGTAELGVKKDFVNSWVTGFFPYDNPRYSFVIMMEHGPLHNLIGAPYVGRQIFDWMHVNTPEYLATQP